MDIIPNYKSLSGDQIYQELNFIYKSSNKQYIGSFNAFIYTSQYEMGNNNYNPTPISVPDKRVKSLDEFIKYVFDILKTELYLQEQYDIYRIKINGNVYLLG